MNNSETIRLFSTCPPCSQIQDGFLDRMADVARWSERAGCNGILIYADNSLVDPWLVAHLVMQSTRNLSPLVAVQPVYMHPYSVAKKVASLATLHQRPVHLNMIAGGFKNDLLALGDATPHDQRYERLAEYTTIIRELLRAETPATASGTFYQVKNLTLSPKLPPHLLGQILMSGSSAAGLNAARSSRSVAIQYPEPPERRVAPPPDLEAGIRLGIVARHTADQAWLLAQQRFPEDRKGQLTRTLATQVSDSSWHKQLARLADKEETRSTYWLRPFEHYHTNCPYLVGSYEQVATELSKYLELGYRTLILDVPAEADDFEHIGITLQRALQLYKHNHSGASVTA